MTDPVYLCESHGFETEAECPVCESQLERILTGSQRRQLSKFMSGALRHFPDDAGLELDDHGWTADDDLVATVTERYEWASREAVDGVVALDPKGRFERLGRQIRAAYGHSVDVTIERDESAEIPATLYHGTDPDNLPSIAAEGLKPMNRQAVHLTDSEREARAVGERHAQTPTILRISTAALRERGLEISKDGRFIYTVEHVPPACIENLDG